MGDPFIALCLSEKQLHTVIRDTANVIKDFKVPFELKIEWAHFFDREDLEHKAAKLTSTLQIDEMVIWRKEYEIANIELYDDGKYRRS